MSQPNISGIATTTEVIPYDQAIAQWMMRPLVNSPIRPNHITTLSLILGIGAALLFALGSPSLVALAPIAFILSRILDHADGELARLSGRTSRLGHKYDIVADFITTTILFVGIGFGEAAGPLGRLAPILGLGAGVCIALIYLLHGGNRACGPGSTDKQLRLGRFEIEDVLYITAPITWLGALTPYLVAASLGAPAFGAFALWQCYFARRHDRPATPDTIKSPEPSGAPGTPETPGARG